VIVLASAKAAAEFAAARFAEAARDAIAARGRFVVALAGGSTPRLLYTTLATGTVPEIDWGSVIVIWGDERCVPADHPASNYRMAREALLSHVSVEEGNIHRIRGESDPVAAAGAYESGLRELLDTTAGPPSTSSGRRIDLALLGLGSDGHAASLFPGAVEAHESVRWVEATTAPSEPSQRVTLTPIVLNAAAEVMFVVTGVEKAAILARVLEGRRVPHELPAQLIQPTEGKMQWVVDAAAASAMRRMKS
jgi:6-phosphogluconolactonase